MTNGFLTRKVIRPLLELLRQGVTPEKLSLSIALGVVLGTVPAIGWNTALCALIAVIWRLNLPAIQMVNYFVYPLQIALIIPFFRLGEKLFRAPHLPISVAQVSEMLRTDLWGAITLLWTTTWHALVVWALMAPFMAMLIYVVLVPGLRRVLKRTHADLATAEIRVAES
ncbi:MAG: DUF2062 domain-containing protein [Candidatus Acidiferrum sp.]